MPVPNELRDLEIDLPALPQALVELSLLLAEEEINLQAAAALIERDMALSAAVLRAVNSSLYGLRGRVQSAQQAITYLGMREVAGITYEMGLRAAFTPTPEIEPIWRRAAIRGLLMGRMAQQLGVDAWAAHSAGLFEECGKAVLLRHAPDHYTSMLRATQNDAELVTLEHVGFGVSHDALGAALCDTWGLAANAVASVRHHIRAQTLGELPSQVPRRAVCALSAFAFAMMRSPARFAEVVEQVAPQAQLDVALVLRAGERVMEKVLTAEAS